MTEERKYPRLTEEQRERVLATFKQWLEAGDNMRKLPPSLIGLPWEDLLESGKESEARRLQGIGPPEFVSIGLTTLDAYIVSVLAAHCSFRELGVLEFRCALEPSGESDMKLRFEVIPERGRIDADPIMAEMLASFPMLLRARNFGRQTVFFLDGEHCPMSFAYPGSMKRDKAPALRNRPMEEWPVIPVRITPTDALRARAQEIVKFHFDSPPESVPN